jgi:putative heme-binding domain-containing protein
VPELPLGTESHDPFDSGAGKVQFNNLCASCHSLNGEGTRLGPDLDGAGKNGIRYYLENIIDPNAVIGTDYQMTSVETKTNEVISGLVRKEDDQSLVIQTALGEHILSKSDIAQQELSPNSLMPEGLLEALNDREKLELLKYLIQN